jgi:hypothetical protein
MGRGAVTPTDVPGAAPLATNPSPPTPASQVRKATSPDVHHATGVEVSPGVWRVRRRGWEGSGGPAGSAAACGGEQWAPAPPRLQKQHLPAHPSLPSPSHPLQDVPGELKHRTEHVYAHDPSKPPRERA